MQYDVPHYCDPLDSSNGHRPLVSGLFEAEHLSLQKTMLYFNLFKFI